MNVVRIGAVYLVNCVRLVALFIMKSLRKCCCFWRSTEDQYKLVAKGDGQEMITIRPKVYCLVVTLPFGSFVDRNQF